MGVNLLERFEGEIETKYNSFLERYPPAYYAIYKRKVSANELKLYVSLVNLANYFEQSRLLEDPDETALKIIALSI